MQIKQYLPSQKFIKNVIKIAFLIVFILIIRYGIYPQIKLLIKKGQIPKDISVKEFVDTDTDGDGLPDWEESIWGTDPKQTDTDGDGVSDLDFVNSKKQGLANIEQNETVVLSSEIMRTLFTLMSKGVSTQEAIANLGASAGQSIVQPELENIYTNKSFKTSPGGQTDIKNYYNNFQKAYTTFAKSKAPDEFDILTIAISSENGDQLVDLDMSIKKYKALEQSLVNLTVPEQIIETHTNLTNNIAQISKALQKSQELYTNSVVGINGIVELRIANTRLDEQVEILRLFFKKNGLIK